MSKPENPQCVPMSINLNTVLLSNVLTLISTTCDKRADIEFNGKKYVIREISKLGKRHKEDGG